MVSKEHGMVNGQYDKLISFGTRSFSMWDAQTLNQIYDSDDIFEVRFAEYDPYFYNSKYTPGQAPKNTYDITSPEKVYKTKLF